MIMVDDARVDDLTYMPRTRALIGGEGVTFANSLSPYPLCCPARSSVLKGQYAHNHSTLATWLHHGGYSTAYIGKYLNGYGSSPDPGKSRGNSVPAGTTGVPRSTAA